MDNFTRAMLSLPIFNGKKRALSALVLTALRILCVLLILAALAGAIYFAIETKTELPVDGFVFECAPSVNYKVNLKENSFFEDETIEMEKNYIRSLVDSIDLDFTNACKTIGDGSVTVRMNVSGKVSTWYVEGGDEKILWEQDEVLTQTDFMALSSSDSKITIPVKIDQNIYAKLVEDFQDELGISANGYYDITCNADFMCESNGATKKQSVPIIVSIPLNGKIFKVNISASEDPVTVRFEDKVTSIKEPNWVLFAFLIIIALVLVFVLLALLLCCEPTQKDVYIEELKAKIASVEDRIAYVRSECDFSDDDIELKDFDSVIRLADERALPIFCARDDVERNAVFFVTENSQKFYYCFSESALACLDEDEEEYFDEEAVEESTEEISEENNEEKE